MYSKKVTCFRLKLPLLPVFVMFLFLNGNAFSQKGAAWNASAGINLPAGNFAETHFPGAGFQIAYSNHRFGKLPVLPKKKFGLILNSGADYYPGKKEKVSGYDFKYGGYFVFHTYAGVLLHADKRTNISLVTGPALSHYQENIRFNIGSDLTGAYYFNRQWGISASLRLLNETGARPLLSAALKACYAFN